MSKDQLTNQPKGQGQRVLAELRQQIIDGELAPGMRVTETLLAERLGVSRQPIRLAFRTLAHEGLLRLSGGRGYRVREVTLEEIVGAIEVRGTLEGMAARILAQRGPSDEERAVLRDCLHRGDELFAKGFIVEEDMETFHDLNMTFHHTIVNASGNKAIAEAILRNDHLPFGSVNSIAIDKTAMEAEYRRFNFANMQHHIIFDAIESGEGTRAEAAMREHANVATRYAEMFGDVKTPSKNLRLIRNAG